MDETERSPGVKLALVIVVAVLLALPIFAVWALVYDRQNQSEVARTSIASGWGGPQTLAGPLLVIPFVDTSTVTEMVNGRQVTRTVTTERQLTVAPEAETLDTAIAPERRTRSIYETVVYEVKAKGEARFRLPADLARYGVRPDTLALDRAELRFGLSDERGLAAANAVTVAGRRVVLQPGKGLPATGGSGFFAWVDAGALVQGPLPVQFAFAFRGNGNLTLAPRAGQTMWKATSPWPHPSFQGGFLPTASSVTPQGFEATWRIGNLALGQALVQTGEPSAAPEGASSGEPRADPYGSVGPNIGSGAVGGAVGNYEARVDLIQPVDLYDQVSRAAKYGFLFIGFTFMAFFMFDVIGGVKVSAVEYLLVGAGLVLFFVMLLAFAEVVGFTWAYLIAAAAIIGLLTAYSSAVLKSWRRGTYIAGLLTALYAVLYILLSLEAYSLLIGSLLLFAALAAVMYLTRNLDWGGLRAGEGPSPQRWRCNTKAHRP